MAPPLLAGLARAAHTYSREKSDVYSYAIVLWVI